MKDRFSLFELARLPEEEAVLRRYDARNLSVARWLMRGLAATAFVQVIISLTGAAGSPLPRLSVAVAEALLAAGFALFLRRLAASAAAPVAALPGRPGRLLRHPRPVILAVLATAALLFLLFSENRREALTWLLIVPWITAALRLRLAERLLLHAYFAAGACLAVLLFAPPGPEAGGDSGLLFSALLADGLALAAALFLTMRFRRNFLEQWRELRGHAQEQTRMRGELADARDIQLAMLPGEAPAAGGLDLAGMSLPASEVGGDYFGTFDTGTGGFAVVAADVAGHGLASGIVLSGIRAGLTLLAGDLDSPGRVLERMHRMVRSTSRRRMLVTLSILQFDPDRRRAIVASAGHPPVLRRRAAGAPWRRSLRRPFLSGRGSRRNFRSGTFPSRRGTSSCFTRTARTRP